MARVRTSSFAGFKESGLELMMDVWKKTLGASRIKNDIMFRTDKTLRSVHFGVLVVNAEEYKEMKYGKSEVLICEIIGFVRIFWKEQHPRGLLAKN